MQAETARMAQVALTVLVVREERKEIFSSIST
jgi:hypothetical protein